MVTFFQLNSSFFNRANSALEVLTKFCELYNVIVRNYFNLQLCHNVQYLP